MRYGLFVEFLYFWMAIRILFIVNLIMFEIFRMMRRVFFLWGILGGMWLYLVGGKDMFCLRDLSGLNESFGFLRFRVLLGCFLLKELL